LPQHGSPQAGPPPPAERSLGGWLRHERERRGLTVGGVADATKINVAYLEAIEDDRFDALPAPVYVRGFVRLYARHLGLDEAEAKRRLPSNLPRPAGLDPLPGLRRHEGAPTLPLPAFDMRVWVGAGVAAMLVAAMFWLGVPGVGLPGFGGEEDGGQQSVDAESTGTLAGSEPEGGGFALVESVPPFEEGEMPELRGLEVGVAEAALQGIGIVPIVIEVQSETAPAGRVFGQSPEAGSSVDENDDVTLVVSTGAPSN
jgi:hypothetical protein